MNLRITGSIVMLCSVAQVAEAQQLVREPAGLQLGDQYRLAFITSTARDSTSSDIEDYNHFVQAAADAAPVVGSWGLEWKAVGSTILVSARDNTGTNNTLESGVPIYRLDGQLIWRDYLHMWETEMGDRHSPLHLFNLTELGTMRDQSSSFFWSGTNSPTGMSTGSAALGETFVAVGHPEAGGDPWDVDITGAVVEYPLLAISEVITVVPEPSAQLCVTLGAITVLAYSRRR